MFGEVYASMDSTNVIEIKLFIQAEVGICLQFVGAARAYMYVQPLRGSHVTSASISATLVRSSS